MKRLVIAASLLAAQAIGSGCDGDDCAVSANGKRCECSEEGDADRESCSNADVGGPSLCCQIGAGCSCGLWECALDADGFCLCSATIWSAPSVDPKFEIVDSCPSSHCCLDTATDGCVCDDAFADGCSPEFVPIASCGPERIAEAPCTTGNKVPGC